MWGPFWTPDGASIVVNHNGTTNETWGGELSMFDAVGATGRRDLTPPLERKIGTGFFIPNAGVAPIFPATGRRSHPGHRRRPYRRVQCRSRQVSELARDALIELARQGHPTSVGGPVWSPDASMIGFEDMAGSTSWTLTAPTYDS